MNIKQANLSNPEQEYLANFISDVSPRSIELKYALYHNLKSSLALELGAVKAQTTENLHRINDLIEELTGQV